FFAFFFQAEDGIRDRNVTGVQTCALPISRLSPSSERIFKKARTTRSTPLRQAPTLILLGIGRNLRPVRHTFLALSLLRGTVANRSEERRVGKECRSQRSTEC